jgi:hypothetical protein
VSGARYRSTREAANEVIRTEGIKGLYRGLGPNIQRAALLTATQVRSSSLDCTERTPNG